MAGYEEIEIIGNVGKAAEMRYTPTGTPVTSFSVAVNKTWTDESGQKREKVKWFRVTCWRKLAEVTAQYVTKGMQVFVKGEVDAQAYTDKEGQARAALELTASVVRFLSGKGEGDSGEGAPAGAGAGGMPTGVYIPPHEDDVSLVNDLPF